MSKEDKRLFRYITSITGNLIFKNILKSLLIFDGTVKCVALDDVSYNGPTSKY